MIELAKGFPFAWTHTSFQTSPLTSTPKHRNKEIQAMAIKVGDSLPEATFTVMGAEGPGPQTTQEVFGGKKVVLFAVPGAFTPTCSKQHLPGFVANADKIKAQGVDTIACTSVNDAFVLNAWSKDASADGKVVMLADGSADFAKQLGLELDLSARGLGMRSQRYAMIVEDGVVKALNVEDAPGTADKSGADAIAALLG
jgi:peroxiredoxin